VNQNERTEKLLAAEEYTPLSKPYVLAQKLPNVTAKKVIIYALLAQSKKPEVTVASIIRTKLLSDYLPRHFRGQSSSCNASHSL